MIRCAKGGNSDASPKDMHKSTSTRHTDGKLLSTACNGCGYKLNIRSFGCEGACYIIKQRLGNDRHLVMEHSPAFSSKAVMQHE